jgi:hypothetical protein
MKVLLSMVVLAIAAVPPLTESQRQQLATAYDRSEVADEGALYPLLENAMQWKEDLEVGARVPDYQALLEEPAAYRGELFLIRGMVARVREGTLSRPGVWGNRILELVIVVQREEQDATGVNIRYMVETFRP